MRNNSSDINHFLGFNESGTFGFLLLLFWTFTSLPFYARGVIVRLMGISVEPYIVPIFFIVAALCCLPTILKATKIWDYMFVAALITVFISSYTLFPANRTYMMDYEEQFIYWSLPFFIVGVSTNFQKCQRLLYVFSVIAVFLQLMSLFSSGVSVNEQGELEDMGRAFGALPPTLFMIWKAFEDKTKLSIIVAVIGILNIIFMGTRGPVLIVVEFIAIFLLFFLKFKNPVRVRIIIVVLSAIAFYLLENSLELLMELSKALGFSGRVFEALSGSANISEIMMESTGRDIIYENMIDAIEKAPFWGYGPGADHIYSDFYEVYAHNIVLEMLIEYGIVPGSIILLLILTLIGFAFMCCREHDTKIFILICVTCGFLGLMTNGVYWTSRAFFFMLGVCISVIRNRKKQQISLAR